MMLQRRWRIGVAVIAAAVIGVGVFLWQVFGPINVPILPPPQDRWEALLRERIKLPPGYGFSVFARDMANPRMMVATAAGDLVVSEYKAGELTLVKADRDGDGRSDGRAVLAAGLNLPHGLVLEGNQLLVAEETSVVAYDFDGRGLRNRRVVLADVPGGGHSSRTLARGPDGFLYLTIGSSCNACIEDHPWRAAMIRFKEGEQPEVYARGLRNTVGFDWQSGTAKLYGVDNGRDQLGDDVPDDEVNQITAGGHYGWPFVHGMSVADPALAAQKPPALNTTLPVHGLGAHVAPLALQFLRFQEGRETQGKALVTEHGSWNRSEKAGYRIMALTISDESVRSEAFLTGCEQGGEVICRPLGLLETIDGAIYVSDDFAGAIYKITAIAAQ